MSSVPVWLVVAALGAILLSFAEGLKESEIDLKVATHARKANDKVPRGPNLAGQVTLRQKKHSVKPNKLFSRKYVQGSLDEIQKGKSPKSMYEKKYFDYLSAEVPTSEIGLSQRINSRRIRRNADRKDQIRTRRHGVWYVQPMPSFSYVMPQRIYPNDWRLQYDPYDLSYRPILHNQYLPPVTSRPVSPEQPTSTPEVPATDIDPGIRGPFNEVQNPFAFDVVYDPTRDTKYILMKTTKKPPVATTPSIFRENKPPPTTTRRPVSSGPVTVTPGATPGTITTTARPSIQHNSEDDFDWSSIGLAAAGGAVNRIGSDANGQDNRIPNSDNRPSTGGNRNSPGTNTNRQAPSKCTWGIANCCSHNSMQIRYYCFEQNQCFGAFWGDNVCQRYYKEALQEIENYYNVSF